MERLHQRLGHRCTRSLMAGYTANSSKDIELSIYPDPFGTLCQISSMNKKARSKNPLNSKAPFLVGFMEIIPLTVRKHLTSETNFSN